MDTPEKKQHCARFTEFSYTKGEIDIFKEKQFHNHFELYLLLNGNVEFLNDHSRQRIAPYTLVIIPPQTYHQFIVLDSPNTYERCVLNVHPKLLNDALVNDALKDKEIFLLPVHHHIVENFLHLKENVVTMPEEDFSFVLTSIATDTLFSVKYLDASHIAEKESLSPLSLKLMTYINAHYTQPLSLETLSKTFNFSISVICHTFKKDFGISIKSYIQQKRMSAIHFDLQNGEKPEQLASKYNYSNYSTFYRAYKKYFNIAPSATQKYN